MSDSWTACTIQDFLAKGEAETKTGPFGTQLHASDYVESGTPVINARNIGFGDIRIDKIEFISEETVHRLSSHLLEPEDIVFGRKGTVERHVFIRSEQAHWFQGTDCLRLRFKSTSIEPRFISYCLLTEFHKKWIINQSSHGATMTSLNQGIISRIPLLLPPLNTQRKITAILSAYDDLIGNNLRRIKILEEMAQNLYREWFVKFRFPGHQHTRFTDSPLGPIPEEWKCGVVNDLLSLKSGFAFKSSIFTEDGTYGLVTIKNVRDGLFVPECTSRIADLPSNIPNFCHLSTGDVLLSLTGNIGRVCLVYGTDYLLNQRVAKLVPIEANNRAYTYFTFRQDEFQTKLSKIANGVAQQNLSPIETGRMQVVIPSQKVLSDFAGICEPIVEEMTALFRKNTTLRRTRDLLLPRLISGEVDVSELDIAVPEEAMT